MKKVKIGLLALSALVGVGAAFSTTATAKSHDSQISRRYGITGVTAGNQRYTVEVFDETNKFCKTQTSITCSGKFTSVSPVSVITKSKLNVTKTNAKYTLL